MTDTKKKCPKCGCEKTVQKLYCKVCKKCRVVVDEDIHLDEDRPSGAV